MASNLVTEVRNLQRRGARRRRGPAVAEGVRLVEEALAAAVPFRGALAAPKLQETPRGARLMQSLADHAVVVEQIPEADLARLADTDSPQGVLAVIEPPRWQLEAVVPAAGAPVLVLDGVQDPGNVGTLMRTAFAMGAAGAVMLKGSADTAHPKVMRAGMGATFRLPAAAAQDGELAQWAELHGAEVWAAASEGAALGRLERPERLALVVGNEGAGVRPFVRQLARQQVSVPLARGAESLNVAVAAGIILYEVQRGR
jgi:TrmH family RNA methyltransferase